MILKVSIIIFRKLKEGRINIMKINKLIMLIVLFSFGFLFKNPIDVDAMDNPDVNSVSAYEQLKDDIQRVESIDRNNIEKFYNENEDWIEDVNNRLEGYLGNIPEDERDSVLLDLRNNGSFTLFSPNTYFNTLQYHFRGGYWTYSMTPKTSTRLLKSYADAGWRELQDFYSLIRSDNGSLEDQYYCHYYARIEADWDIELGRPNVGLTRTIAALCNP